MVSWGRPEMTDVSSGVLGSGRSTGMGLPPFGATERQAHGSGHLAIEPTDPVTRGGAVNTYDTARFGGSSDADREWLRQREHRERSCDRQLPSGAPERHVEQHFSHHGPSSGASPLSPQRSPAVWSRVGEFSAPPSGGGDLRRDRSAVPLSASGIVTARGSARSNRAESLERSMGHPQHQDHRDRMDRSTMLDSGGSASGAMFKVPILPKDMSQTQRAFEQVQTELLFQSRRQDEALERIGKVEGDLSRVAKLTVENEGLHATERQQKHQALQNLTRRTEDALLTCDSLRNNQDHMVQKIERIEQQWQEGERATEEVSLLQKDVDSLQGTVREKLGDFGHALRRLEAMERIFDENTKLRQEVAQLRRQNERRDLEMAAVQGQIDALTKLVREQLKDPHSPRKIGEFGSLMGER